MSAENKALLRRWFAEVWNQGRPETIDALLAPGAVVHGSTGDLHGRDAFKAFQAAYRNAFPDVRVDLEEIVAEGNMVAGRWRVLNGVVLEADLGAMRARVQANAERMWQKAR